MYSALKKEKKEKKNKTLKKILNKIDNELAAKKITYTQLSKCWGISVSGVSDVFSFEREISFCYLAKTLVLLYEDHSLRRELLLEYLEVAKPENLREALEYLTLRGEFDLVEMLVSKEQDSDTPENKEWSRVYKLIHKNSQIKIIKKETLMNYYDSLEEEIEVTGNYEMKILIDILLCYTSYQLGDYRLINKRLKKIKNKASKIKNKFIKKCYKVRIDEGLAAIYLTSDQLDEVRECCDVLLKSCKDEAHLRLNKARALWLKAESFIFDDYEQSLSLFHEALELLNDNVNSEVEKKRKAIIKTIQFLKIYHNKDLHTLGIMENGERAFFEIRMGNLEGAIEILMNIERENEGLSSFELVYLGMARNDREIIKKGLRKFEEKNSLFYARFPKKELGLI